MDKPPFFPKAFMTQQTKLPPRRPQPAQPSHELEKSRLKEKAEPVEVLGRHKNSGQKDHKGAR